jgi:hypothetical protein
MGQNPPKKKRDKPGIFLHKLTLKQFKIILLIAIEYVG